MMIDIFSAYMQGNPEITFHDTPIDRFSAEAFAPFADESGALWLVVEQDQSKTEPALTAIEKSIKYLRSLGL